jgi:hypothetical protein
MSDKVYFCRICGGTWEQLPPEAERLTTSPSGKGYSTYRFGGVVHVIRLKKAHRAKETT